MRRVIVKCRDEMNSGSAESDYVYAHLSTGQRAYLPRTGRHRHPCSKAGELDYQILFLIFKPVFEH